MVIEAARLHLLGLLRLFLTLDELRILQIDRSAAGSHVQSRLGGMDTQLVVFGAS